MGRQAAEHGLEFVDELPPSRRELQRQRAQGARARPTRRRPRVFTPPDHVAPDSHRAHGTYVKYVVERCRCEPCRAANREYERARVKAIQRPDEVWMPYVPAGPARRHLADLARHGIGLPTVSRVSGVAHGALSKIVYGDPKRGSPPSRRIRPATMRKILSVGTNDAAGGAKIPAGPTLALLDDLIARGFTKVWLATEIAGEPRRTLQVLRNRDGLVRASTARRIAELHRRLEGQDAPPRKTRWSQ